MNNLHLSDRVLYGRRDYLRILFGDVRDDETNE